MTDKLKSFNIISRLNPFKKRKNTQEIQGNDQMGSRNSRMDLTTAARLTFDINYRRFLNADYMFQLFYPHSRTTFKCLFQLWPLLDSLQGPSEAKKYGEVCATLKLPIGDVDAASDSSSPSGCFMSLKLNVNDGAYLQG